MENRLWFHYQRLPSSEEIDELQKATAFVCRRLHKQAEFEIWHNRLGHPGSTVIYTIHKHAEGVPKLMRNRFYKCSTCLLIKFRRKARGIRKNVRKNVTEKKGLHSETYDNHSQQPPVHHPSSILPSQNLYMDFGFVRGTDWTTKDEDGRTVSSIDGNSAYLLIIDEATRWIWVFPTASKTPPIDLIRGVLQQFPDHPPGSTIRCDHGGELGRSQSLAKMKSTFYKRREHFPHHRTEWQRNPIRILHR